jgi:ElaB/YqjD/DUF883 family membrane-anchored ribosome-binding protein
MRRNQAVQAAFDLGPATDGPARFVAIDFGRMERDIMADTAKTTKPRKTAAKSTNTGGTPVAAGAGASATTTTAAPSKRDEAKSRFNAALDEARAGAALLGAEARERASAYGVQARERGDDWTADAKTKASELAVEGKAKASEAISSLGRVVGENAATIDERFGSQYGDYARSASRTLQNTASKLEQKSVEQIGEDAREFVRKSPAAAVGLAALAGFLLARMFRR